MLTTSTRLRLQNICSRLAQGQFVSLQERVYLQKFERRSKSTWVDKAQRFQREGMQQGLDGLMADLDQVDAIQMTLSTQKMILATGSAMLPLGCVATDDHQQGSSNGPKCWIATACNVFND